MILFETIRWKNFLSTGNQYTEVNFTENKTNLIIGTNGAGKSTVLDALTFSLFGKPFRKINKPQLINSTNEKDCRVEVCFSVNNTEWKIVRGIKPNVFEIWRNDSLMDQFAAALDQQKWLEQNVLKMNYKSFTQIVILGSSTFVPFMQLTTNNRREVIEDLLDIKIFSSMNTIIKEKIRQSKEEIKVLNLKKESLTEKVTMQETFIGELEQLGKESIQKKEKKVTELLKEVEVYMRDNSAVEESIFAYTKEQEYVTGATQKLRKLGQLKGKISNKVSTITKEHKFFTENTVCPTCDQAIEETFRINRIKDAQVKAKELQTGYKELEEAIKEEEERERQFTALSKEISKLNNDISQNNVRIAGCQRQISNLESEVQRTTEQLANRNTEHEKLETFKDNLKTTYDELSSRKDTINYYDFSYSLLKDGGVKSKIIKKYLPLINQQVNRYLQMMDFYINFTLDEEFNETVQSPIHEDFSYASFSEGEKMRIDLALLFTWREVARMKNSVNTNLLIMDEVFDSSLDGFGTEEFLKIIKYVVKDANIFVISHKSGLEDRFDSVTRFEKVKGFSHKVS
ncbi:SbcC-like subunit of palindrome specific endonuclease [Synechococcus phage S-SM2]|uniref:Recombination endonuclease subunit n=1 Tax=Synechococcus phage S-SM2 TaxID=444860 RepID=E3SJ24_9CAUD|nr:SbcC-like subunit of palindrome specific endonuclease [Synechococcus phage S-SM2]ADO97472.1 recombination endonuclease subunit [Synechococcus phage S-SM2]